MSKGNNSPTTGLFMGWRLSILAQFRECFTMAKEGAKEKEKDADYSDGEQ